MLMEEIDYNILFRWFVGLNLDDEVWDAMVFTKNGDRLLEAEVAKDFWRWSWSKPAGRDGPQTNISR
jgi:hypothetical protein